MLLHFLPLPGLSRSFRPTRSLALSSLIQFLALLGFSPFHRLDQSVIPAHSVCGFLLFLCSALAQSVIPAHSVFGCLHLFLSPPPLPQPSTASTQSVIPAHSVPGCLLACFHLPFLYLFSTAWTQSVIPAHSVCGGLHSFFHSPIILFHFCLDSVGHSGPLSLRLPLIHGLLLHPCSTFSTLSSGNLLVSFLFDSVVLSLPSSSGLLTPVYSLYARDSVTGSPTPLIHFVSSFFSARRPVATGIQSDLRCVATNVDPK